MFYQERLRIFPDIETTLIEERDKYMADSIRNAVSFPLVAVVGAAHVPGMTKILREDIPVDRSVLDQVPPSGKISKILKWLIPTSIVLLILAGSFRSGKETGGAMAASWVLATSSTAALGGIIALAHPFTILVAAFVAPVTAVNPFLRSGWIAAIIEATTRRPRVGDLENILDDMTSIRGWYGNRVCRVLLVLISVNLMGIVGGALAVPILARYIW
jgi:pheromone shutdown protein TraB